MSEHSAKLHEHFENFKNEDAKFQGGNKAAGTRARKHLMEIKKTADARRKEIQTSKNEE